MRNVDNTKQETSVRQRRFAFLDERPTQEYGSRSEYYDAVRNWVAHYKFINDLQQQAHLAFQAATAQVATVGNLHHLQAFTHAIPGNTVIRAPNGGTIVSGQYRPASFIRRIFAELIDFALFFFLKLFILYMFIELELLDLTQYEKLLGNQADLQALIDVTQDLFPLEIMGKFVASLIECACISIGIFRLPPGATPGKMLMSIKVISAKSVTANPHIPGQVIVTGLDRVPVVHALIRSLFKNLFINSFLPLSSIAFAFNHNRAVYDIVAQTIVVDA